MTTDKRPKIDWSPIVFERPESSIERCDIHDMWYFRGRGCVACRIWLEKT